MLSRPTGSAALLLSMTVLFGAIPLAVATPAQAASTDTRIRLSSSESDVVAQSSQDLVVALGLIEEIPEDVLVDGGAATRRWLTEEHPELFRQSRGSVLACTAATAGLIASTAIPVAKILRIKALIKAGGGVAKVVRVYWGASFSYEKIKAIGGVFGALALELIGVTAVKKGCF